MARVCELCGKGTLMGKDSVHKHGGMWARRAPTSRRKWKPNLRKVKVQVNGANKTMRICAQCLKSSRIKKVEEEV
jgi:large subunit ribosomal protein L28